VRPKPTPSFWIVATAYGCYAPLYGVSAIFMSQEAGIERDARAEGKK